jgi:hypothetical protein
MTNLTNVSVACLASFEQYAPDPPFDEQETIAFFHQMVRQLGNLAHCTSPKQPNYLHYFHLLEQLATIRIGLVLVELCRTMDDNHEALDSLVELVKTLLTVVHIEHAQEVANLAATAVASILEEFDATIPIPILDIVLSCVAQGPIVMVTNPAAVEAAAKLSRRKSKKPESMPPSQIQQTNPSYLVAANALRKVGEKIASPVSAFLNGLWNGDTMIIDQTSISTDDSTPNVWSTIYELHKIAPQILTTVIGTVASSLTAPQDDMRIKVVKLLGRLFYSPNSKIGTQFSACFREWLRRHVDISSDVRITLVKYLAVILANRKTDLIQDTTTTLKSMISSDPDQSVRVSAIHQVCDLAFKDPTLVPANLLEAVGARVSSKSKTERKDALIGLAQIYYKHYILPKLQQVQSGGDDCAIGIVMEALHGEFSHTDKYSWIPAKVFECASFHDDTEMQNLVIQIVDEILLGSQKSPLTGTSRAVGFAIVVNSLEQPSNAQTWMSTLMSQRASVQQALSRYIDSRTKLRQCKPGTEEALTADASAFECLEALASTTGLTNDDSHEVLQKLHSARDNHIFKILATIADPTHSMSARVRALDELPKRTMSLGDATSNWVKTLSRRTAMGYFANVDVVHHVILLAQECLHEGDYEGSSIFMSSLKSLTDAFPSLSSKKDDFMNLLELFTECRSITNPKAKKEIQKFELITKTSSIVAAAAKAVKSGGIDYQLHSQLLNLCTRDGTPEQARNAVQTMTALLMDKKASPVEQEELFSPLLKALTSPSRLSIAQGSSSTICALAALSALADQAPSLFGESTRGIKALRFALETVLMGRGASLDDHLRDDDEEEEDLDPGVVDQSPVSAKKRRKSNQSPGTKNALEDDQLSVGCRRACAAIEFLVAHIRSALIRKVERPTEDHIDQVFNVLHQILQDSGLPPCSRDRRECRSRQDRAALRAIASTSLFRLCDTRLHLLDKHLTITMWHTLSCSLLDEEKRVRETAITELGFMLTGSGVYASGASPLPANLRFFAMVVFCVDSEGSHIANGNAANVGKACSAVKTAATQGIVRLRKTADLALHQSRAIGKAAEQNYEHVLKKQLMPEYCVPYAVHLLSLRRETPSAGGITVGVPGATQLAASQSSDEENDAFDDSAHQKILRKRLKWLFEPLVLSLGEGADNISFLLRMTDTLGGSWQPKECRFPRSTLHSPSSINDALASNACDSINGNLALLTAQMKTVCAAAREVLLSFVKKDVNLAPYPGNVEIPRSLFRELVVSSGKRTGARRREESAPFTSSQGSLRSSESSARDSIGTNISTSKRFCTSLESTASNESIEFMSKRRKTVTFSPELMPPPHSKLFTGVGDVSPIAKSDSPASTRGTTPPSMLRTVPSPPSSSSLASRTASRSQRDDVPPSATQTSGEDEDEDDVHLVSSKSLRETGKRPLKPALVKINVRSSQSSLESAGSRGSTSRRRNKTTRENEFDFDGYIDTVNKENTGRGRTSVYVEARIATVKGVRKSGKARASGA